MANLMDKLPKKKKREALPIMKGKITQKIDAPEESKILVNELTKVLFLNNKNPRKVINCSFNILNMHYFILLYFLIQINVNYQFKLLSLFLVHS